MQFVTVFLGSFISGTFLNQARTLITAPTSIPQTLGTAAPLTSIFFLTWIELNVSHLPLAVPPAPVPLSRCFWLSEGQVVLLMCKMSDGLASCPLRVSKELLRYTCVHTRDDTAASPAM